MTPPQALTLDAPLGPPTAAFRPMHSRLSAAPPWLVSLTVHLAAILLLAAWGVTREAGYSPHFVTLAAVEEAAIVPLQSPPSLQMEVIGQPIDAAANRPRTLDDVPVSPVTVSLDATAYERPSPITLAVDVDALSGLGGSGLASKQQDLPGAEFFGVQAYGSKFVFVVDNSNSMRIGKLDSAKEELLYAIRRLNSDQYFYVIFFHGEAVPMALNEAGDPEPEPLPATSENILKLEAWVETVDVDPWTNPHDAMRQAVEMGPDAIYLLSDGRFTDRGETIRFLKAENYVRELSRRRPKVVIHTVGFHQRDGESTLKNIARSFGGTYRFVAPPK